MIGANIKSYRRQKRLSLSELAMRANISKSYLSYIERDLKQNPSIDVLKKIASAMDVSLDDLLGTTHSASNELSLDEEWVEIIQEAVKAGISKEHFQDYVNFVNWKNHTKPKE
ncbi:XRE family transcriptional regulator, master regulator for biofilm formation [Alteribacillus persepolensis]|uniref:XRE family transcriptional regulator, master regulator for biofilm formation n=1 Tax=Alteribacillus persepolensis TaxID=568899 RepID=A0A1G8JRI1_9BACI|nr:helix-turn-helix domain-containing protein [Alteribacillus persepolensis]SDI33792.1 XRE family transcriptional regulator, master regulator for biofilm formation [Alteribacillus persepolensis]